jgi:hypothetical protein
MTSPEPVTNDRLTRCGLIGHISLKKVFSTRACWWVPDSFFHRRRPTFLTHLTVQSRAVDRFDLVADILGGTMTFAPRAIEDEMNGTFRCAETVIDIELLATSGDGGVVGSVEFESHQRQN